MRKKTVKKAASYVYVCIYTYTCMTKLFYLNLNLVPLVADPIKVLQVAMLLSLPCMTEETAQLHPIIATKM